MRVESKVSGNVIDRRKLVATGALGGIFASLFAWLFVAKLTGTPQDPQRDLVFVVSTALDHGQTFWKGRFQEGEYRPARVVIFEHTTSSGCGRALSQSGPFYCPGDERIYLDLEFLRSIRGDLARAYVIYHELGHHVQKLTGADLVGGFSVELQADCYAGAAIRSAQLFGIVEVGDIATALDAAAQAGDDIIRPEAPETWTHGTADMRLGAVQSGLAGVTCQL